MRQSIFKKYVGLLSLLFVAMTASAVQRGDDLVLSNSLKIGGTAVAAASAGIELNSITKGLLISRMTTAQRDAIVSPATGLMVYNTTTSAFNYWDGATWTGVGAFVSPMTTDGDMITQAAGVSARLGIGATGTALTSNGSAPSWNKIADANVAAAAAIAVNKLAAQTASKVAITDGSGFLSTSTVTPTTLAFLDIGSSLTTLLAAKAPTASPTFTGTITTPLTASRVVVTGASNELAASSVTSATLAFLDIGSSLTTLLGAKAPTASPTFTGTFTGPWTTAGPLITSSGGVVTSEATLAIARGGTGQANLNGLTLGSPIISDYITMTKTSSPSTPASGKMALWADSGLGRLWLVDDNNWAGDLTLPAGTVGNREYVTNTNCRAVTTGWSTYQDSAAVPVDMTGGSVTGLTKSCTTTLGEYVAESSSFKLAKDAANRQGGGIATDITVDPADYEAGKPVWISFKYRTSTNYVTGDLICYALESGVPGTPQKLTGGTTATDAGVLAATNGGVATYTGFFTPSSTTSSSYRFGCHIATTNANAWNFFFGRVHAGSINYAPSAFITDWQSWTPTGSWSANTTYTGYRRRVGDSEEYRIKVATGGAPTSAALTINLPSGSVIDTSKLANTATVAHLGTGFISDSDTTTYGAQVNYSSTTAVAIKSTNTDFNWANVTQAAPFTFGSGDYLSVQFSVPIVTWAASNVIGTNELALSTVKARYYASTQALVSGVTTNVTYNTKDYDDFGVYNGTTFTSPKSAYYKFIAKLQVTSTFTASNGIQVWAEKNGSSSIAYGAVLQRAGYSSSDARTAMATDTVFLAKGDTLVVRANVEGTSPSVSSTNSGNQFSIEEQPNFSIVGLVPGGPPTQSIVTISSHTGGFSANATGTYTVPAGVRYLKIKIVGGGGGGGGSGSTQGTAPQDGGTSTFGSTLFSVTGGGQGVNSTAGVGAGGGGACTITAPAYGLAQSGASGSASGTVGATGIFAAGVPGGNAPYFAGGGGAGPANGAGLNAQANSGSGGGGAGGAASATTGKPGSGGGSAGFCDGYVSTPAASYAYTVGAGGNGGTAGTSGFAGGNGAGGQIIIDEYY